MTFQLKAAFALVGAVIIGGFIYGAYQYPQAIGSPAGSTFNTAKVAEITLTPTTSAASSTSILNGDSSDRIIDSGFVSCATSSRAVFGLTSAGVASWNWLFATTTISSLGLQGNTNYAANIVVSTSTTDNEYASSATSTPTSVYNRLWPSGTYLTFNANATSSNLTISCQAGVYYHGT